MPVFPKGLPLVFVILFIFAGPARSGGEEPPLSLAFADAADLAVAASHELRGEYAMKAIREGAWVLGLRAYLPRLTLSVSEDDRLSKIDADSFLKNYGVSLDQLLWDGGRTSMSRKLEKMELTLLGAQLERMAADIAESAVAAYRTVLFSRAVLEIREAALESLAEQRRLLRREVELGLALPVDLAEAEVSVAEAETELQLARIELGEGEKQFAEILGFEELPPLKEKVDIRRETVLPPAAAARALAEQRNPDLAEGRYAIAQKQGELKYAARSWIPTLRLSGGFGLSGSRYPLSRHTWSVGINIEFASPWFQNTLGTTAGWEPPYDRSARLQNSLSPLPDPAAGLGKRQAELALSLEKTKYDLTFERTGRAALLAVEQCRLGDRKRSLAVESLALAAERYRLEEVRLGLGQITRIDLMEARLEYAQKAIAAVEAAAALLEAERELERLLDLRPGELAVFAAAETGPRE
ncbi:MAG: TolC family protein [Treponema sp.]|jgi:outer membrane protein TolC|nr:TolC family protein [Treponema sp.]